MKFGKRKGERVLRSRVLLSVLAAAAAVLTAAGPALAAGIAIPGLGAAPAVSAAAGASDYASWRGSWAAPYIGLAMADGIIAGFPDGSFQPGQPLTRAQFAELLWKVLGRPVVGGSGSEMVTVRVPAGVGLPSGVAVTVWENPLGGNVNDWTAYQADVRGSILAKWYGPGVDFLAGAGVIHSVSPPGRGYWSGSVNRLQAATWTGRILEKFNLPPAEMTSYLTVSGQKRGLTVPFPSTWAAHGLAASPTVSFLDLSPGIPQYESVQFAAVAGIVTGIANPNGPPSFDPTANLTRAQGAAIIDRTMAALYAGA